MSDTDRVLSAERSWKIMYVIGAIAAIMTLVGTLLDIVITTIPGWQTSTVPTSVEQWFAQFLEKPLLGLRNLDLLNITVSVIGIPMYIALYGAHRKVSQGLAVLALVMVTIGTSVFIARNVALPMLDLSRQFSLATNDAQRFVLQGAAQGLLAIGAHGSFGAFAGFFLTSVAILLMALAMLEGRVFSRFVAWIGIIGTILLLVYIFGTTFGLASGSVLMAIAMPGGIMMIVWNIIVAIKLFQFAAKE